MILKVSRAPIRSALASLNLCSYKPPTSLAMRSYCVKRTTTTTTLERDVRTQNGFRYLLFGHLDESQHPFQNYTQVTNKVVGTKNSFIIISHWYPLAQNPSLAFE
jgi:hypothetical protein